MNFKTCKNLSFVVHGLFTEPSRNFPEAFGRLPEDFENLPRILGRNLPASRAVQAPCTETLTGALARTPQMTTNHGGGSNDIGTQRYPLNRYDEDTLTSLRLLIENGSTSTANHNRRIY